jgi:hypothetical protein
MGLIRDEIERILDLFIRRERSFQETVVSFELTIVMAAGIGFCLGVILTAIL